MKGNRGRQAKAGKGAKKAVQGKWRQLFKTVNFED